MTASREEQIRALLPLVRQGARRVARMVPGADFEDLVGDGSVGLIRAVDSFEAERGVPLDQYARRVIVGAMLNGVRRLDPVSERVRRTIRVAERDRFALAQAEGTLPDERRMESRHPALVRARTEALRGTPLSLDAPLPPGERVAPDFGADPAAAVAEHSERERIAGAVAALPPRQRDVVVAHYYAERSLRSLGEPMNISPQRVSQLHLLAVARLRKTLAAGA